jgi:ABC-type branched-subunit amino acid transport system permease subunit
MYIVFTRTRLGMMIRAGSTNREMVQSLGIDIQFLYRVVFAAGVAIAVLARHGGRARVIGVPRHGQQVLIICFVVVVIGGIGSITRRAAGSPADRLRGHLRQGAAAAGAGVLVYVLMALILLWKPGRPVQGRMTTMTEQNRQARPSWPAPSGAGLWPLVSGSFGIDLVTKIMIYAIFASGLELLVGSTGPGLLRPGGRSSASAPMPQCCCHRKAMPALGAVAAAGSAWCWPRFTPWPWARLRLRTKGVYFIMVTLAFAQMAYYVVHDTPLGGGTDGIDLNVKPVVGPLSTWTSRWSSMVFTLVLPDCHFRLPGLISALALRPGAGRHQGE